MVSASAKDVAVSVLSLTLIGPSALVISILLMAIRLMSCSIR